MKIAYTICSANYLPYAKSMADSLIQHNPEYQVIIGLADTYNNYNPAFFQPHKIVPVTGMQISVLDDMNARYEIFELCCALKPFVAEFIFKTYESCDTLLYFDSDILLYSNLSLAEFELQRHSILLTPHVSIPLPAKISVEAELDVLRTGLYNAGFFGLRRTETSLGFLEWWKERLVKYSFNDAAHGLFVDQLWLDLVPLYFKDTSILFDPGYNLAYWNFNERVIEKKDGGYFVNGNQPLVFFHFSGHDIEQPDKISKHQRAHCFEKSPHLQPLFDNYIKTVIANNTTDYLSLPCTLGTTQSLKHTLPTEKKSSIKLSLKKLFSGLVS